MSNASLDINNITFKGVSFAYEGDENVLEDVSVEFPGGKVFWLTGPHGNGKSVLMKLLCGLETPQSGDVYMNELAVSQLSFEEFLPFRLRIGYSFDYGGLLNNKTIQENLALPLEYHNFMSKFDIATSVLNYLELFGLKAKKNSRPSAVTGGMRKATCVARAFVNNPSLLLLDDPTTGLRSRYKTMLAKRIQEKILSGEVKYVFVASEDKEFLAHFEQLVPIKIEGKKVQFDDVVPGHYWRKDRAS